MGGILSDWLEPTRGVLALGWAMMLVAVIFSLASGLAFYLAARTLVADMNRATEV